MKKLSIIFLPVFLLTACVTNNLSVPSEQTQAQMRAIQSRAFDTADRAKVTRSVVSTMQDLGFTVRRADNTLGIVSGRSVSQDVLMTVTIREEKGKRIIVRMNARLGANEVVEPLAYRNFFNALEKSLFLDAHMVE